MAARKLQTEIDRTLKKVTEGVELFESIYDKMQACTNPTQKDKLETDLKTQIKKLQRLRDQIKTWVASNDIKDKTQLLEYRRLIETQMEKFKACEKEMKTKAFSKEGLIAAMRLDPAEKAKHEASSWLTSMLDELTRQVELAEAEIETLGNAKRKHKGAASERQTTLEGLNERRKWHQSRLEIVLRLLENGSLQPDQVNDLKDGVTFFVESNTEEGFDEDESIYDDLNLDEEETALGLGGDDTTSDDDGASDSDADVPHHRTPLKDTRKTSHDDSTSKTDSLSPTLKKAPVVLQLKRPGGETRQAPPPAPNFAAQPMASAVKANIPTARPPTLPPIRYSAAAAAAVNTPAPPTSQAHPPATPAVPSTPAATNGTTASSNGPSYSTPTLEQQSSANTSSPSFTQPSLSNASPILSSIASPPAASSNQLASSTPPPQGSTHSFIDSPTSSHALSENPVPQSTSSPRRTQTLSLAGDSPVVGTAQYASNAQEQQQPLLNQSNGGAPLPPGLPLAPAQQQPVAAQSMAPPGLGAQAPMVPPGMGQQAPVYPPGVSIPQQAPADESPAAVQQQYIQRPAPNVPGALADLAQSFDAAKQKAVHRMNNLDQVHKALEVGYHSIPQPQDTEKPKYYVPRSPYQTPPYYPQQPISSLSTASVFSQLDVDTLFYVFYFLPGTYQQYLAAKELKKQSWRFHLKYLTWFQRHSEPQAITDEYEQGVYVYFDWEGSWCQRKKSDFRFEYRYLSED